MIKIHTDKTTETKSNAATSGMAVQQGVAQEGIFQLEDNRPETIAQRKIQEAANNNPNTKQLKVIQAMANNSLQIEQLKAGKALINNSQQIKQFKAFQGLINNSQAKTPAGINHSNKVLQRQITVHDSNHNEDDGRASHVDATIDGDTLLAGANAPAVYPDGWDDLSEKYIMDEVFRLHLWNGRLGGPGNQSWNLVPGIRDANDEMANEEVNAQAAVNDGHLVILETDVDYGHIEEPEYYYPTHIDFSWLAQDADDGTQVDDGEWSADIPLPEERDMDWDPNNPDDFGMEDSDDPGF